MGGLTVYAGDTRASRRSSLKHHDGPSFDLPAGQGSARVVDLVERIAPRHQLVQRQPPLPEPPDKHREVALGPARTTGGTAEDLAHEHIPRIDRRWCAVRHAHE